ncbi:hypothetical protein [Bradyrhizobium sp.]|jgi:hypothetical protein|uniref:hypothetical protein n=1 Tax=Bradyrhizobium sp. TaxID=376 RepID=UPI002DFEB84C|nr:hypothetical protein [Bradyrhizobium sp.]
MGIFSRISCGAVLAAAALSLAACAAAVVGPEHPGTRVTFKSPDPQKWIGTRAAGERRSIFRCRPLACPENSIVTVRTAASPTRSPDPIALQKFAQEDAKRQMEQTEQASTEAVGRLRDLTLLSTRVMKMKEFPTVHWEYRAIGANDKTIYIVRDMVFAGNTMIDVISTSLGIEVARRNGNDFVGVLDIEDFAPPPPSAAPPPAAGSTQR